MEHPSQEFMRFEVAPHTISASALSRDGIRLLICASDGACRVIDLVTRELVSSFQGPADVADCL